MPEQYLLINLLTKIRLIKKNECQSCQSVISELLVRNFEQNWCNQILVSNNISVKKQTHQKTHLSLTILPVKKCLNPVKTKMTKFPNPKINWVTDSFAG